LLIEYIYATIKRNENMNTEVINIIKNTRIGE